MDDEHKFMWLSSRELEILTGCRTPAAQVLWLKRHHAKHVLTPIGTVIILRSVAETIEKDGRDFLNEAAIGPGCMTIPKKLVGIYFLKKENEVVYVGKTTNFLSRMAPHTCSEYDFEEISFVPVEAQMLDIYEREYIARFRPKYNVMHNKNQNTPVESIS